MISEKVKKQIIKNIHNAPLEEIHPLSDYGYVVEFIMENKVYYETADLKGKRKSHNVYRKFSHAVLELMYGIDDLNLIKASERVLKLPLVEYD